MPEDFRNIHEGLSIYVKAGTSIFLLLAGAFLFFMVNAVRRKRKLLARQKELELKHTQSLLQTQIEIQEQTLKTISQEIHDNVGQALSLAKLNLNTLQLNTGSTPAEKIEESIQLISKAINDLRDLSRSINGDKMADLGLLEAIKNEVRIANNTGLFNIILTTGEQYFTLPSKQEMVAFRIVQEALHNAIKHSQASSIKINMNYSAEECEIIVEDNGAGFDIQTQPKANTGIGLRNMQNRAQLLNASLRIISIPGKGTHITLTIKNC